MNNAPLFVPSTRAQVITRRTYNRPLDSAGTIFETWEETVDRVIGHQRWLWERAQGKALRPAQVLELESLRSLMLQRKVTTSGRTLWLGGTDVAKRREASMFNCSFGRTETVHDTVDQFWLLLQGCGVGFEPIVGVLSGFSKPVELQVVRSTKTDPNAKGNEQNVETFTQEGHRLVWKIVVGDSAEAWAKLPGKLLANKRPCDRLILDFSEIRPAGIRLSGYGWISSGDETISKAMEAIVTLLNHRAGRLLTRIDILDILNHLGTTLSSRRSAEIALVPYGDPEWSAFATAKKDHWIDNPQRAQSNNSLLFYHKPTRNDLTSIFDMIVESGGSEPGFINATTALTRAPWFKGCNPCAEILLGNKSFCNLVEVDLAKFNGDWNGLIEAVYLVARANYRQTCVDLRDGVLQSTWHELNEFLRLTGVGLTGIVRWEYQHSAEHVSCVKRTAVRGSWKMADELNLPRSQAVTTIKPSGTLSKIMDTTEGIHRPLGRYIFNNVRFSKHDPLVDICREAGYRVFDDPYASDAVLITFPVSWEDVDFDTVDGKHVNLESAVSQLDRYKFMMDHYVQHNCSITVSYDPSEVPEIVDWIDRNWDTYVGVSFLFRTDPTKTAEDLGYPYLPQEVVDKDTFYNYANELRSVNLTSSGTMDDALDADCATGACPIR
ncbi:ribonucleoside-triphosphate reductase [Microvirga flocculans]|uniref:Adenosylcobalamin-dependent ribonucleoside-triphosphate reductase n=1 Tax=Microvirga flocculans TaxID=217168 RepID=A0A7W6ICU2_9HYPH|nr:ribonucleoside-triphosphate reductase, adenosylcobalamin-dependent [Microvirga flocculans]MBB4039117.1 ribonucleoside-triphosphate reductase [Microvirga flocculans]